jgi:hypothetical protein
MGERRGVRRIFVGKPGGKGPRGKPRFMWEDNIRTDFKEIVWEGVDWIDLAQDMNTWRVVAKKAMNLLLP